MKKALSLLAVFAILPLSAAAAEGPARTIEVDGQAAEYRSRLDDAGIVHLTGRMLASGEAFRFQVLRSGRVIGNFGTGEVEFRVARRHRERVAREAATALASREAGAPADLATGDR